MEDTENFNTNHNLNLANRSSSINGQTSVEKTNTAVTIEVPMEKGIVARLIRAIRETRSYSQTRLGRIIGVQKSQISKLEKGDNNITLNTMIKIFKALKIKVGFKVELEKENEAIKVKEMLRGKENLI